MNNMKKLTTLFIFTLTSFFIVHANEIEKLDALAALSKQQLIDISQKMKNDPNFMLGNISPYFGELQKRPEIFSTDRNTLSAENKTLIAKHLRFDACMGELSTYFKEAESAQKSSQESDFDTKEKWFNYISMTVGLNYPFTKQEIMSPLRYPTIIALEKSWQYKNNPQDGVLEYYNSCMKIPLQRYFNAH